MMRKIITIILVVFTMMSLVSCQQGSNTSEETSSLITDEKETSETETTDATASLTTDTDTTDALTTETTAETIVFREFEEYEIYGSEDMTMNAWDLIGYVYNMYFKEKIYEIPNGKSWVDKNISDIKVLIDGKEHKLIYERTGKASGYYDERDLYVSPPNTDFFIIAYVHGTNETLLVATDSESPPIAVSEVPLKTEDEFIAYASKVASDYINVDEYNVSIIYEEKDENSNSVTLYNGDRYIFSRYVGGIKSNDKLIISINSKGEVRYIERLGKDHFIDCVNISIDNEKLDKSIIEKVDDLLLRSDLEDLGYTIEKTLFNFDGTLCAEAEVTVNIKPTDEYDSETITFKLFVPVAEKLSESEN